MNKYNKELIEKLRNGKIALEYDNKSLGDLRNILKEAFPKDSYKLATGNAKYYGKFSETTWYGSSVIPWNKNVPIKDFIQEEFVLPEKWAVKNDINKIVGKWFNKNKQNSIQDYALKYTNKYFHYPAVREKEYILDNEYYHVFDKIQSGYTEITYKQFQKYVLKQDNNMENKEIIGYKAPYDLFGGLAKKGFLFISNGTGYYHTFINDNKNGEVIPGTHPLPKEIVETWEPVYKSKEQVFNMGSFEVVVRDGKAFHKNDDITSFVNTLIKTYNSLGSSKFGNYEAILQDVTFSKTGCQNSQTKLSDWRKVYNALNQ